MSDRPYLKFDIRPWLPWRPFIGRLIWTKGFFVGKLFVTWGRE